MYTFILYSWKDLALRAELGLREGCQTFPYKRTQVSEPARVQKCTSIVKHRSGGPISPLNDKYFDECSMKVYSFHAELKYQGERQ